MQTLGYTTGKWVGTGLVLVPLFKAPFPPLSHPLQSSAKAQGLRQWSSSMA